MEPRREIFDIEKVIMNAPFLDEGTLEFGNKIFHMWRKANGEHLGGDLSKTFSLFLIQGRIK
jgi:hypothetical protein